MKKTININDSLLARIEEYRMKSHQTITEVINYSLFKFFDSLDITDKLNQLLLEAIVNDKKRNPKI